MRTFLRCCMALLCCFPLFLQAQFSSSTMSDLLNMSVTTATDTEQDLADVPATTYVFTQDDIRARAYHSLIELLMDVPEIEIQDRSVPEFYNSITVRGIEGSDKLLILLDGMRINSLAGSKHILDRNFFIRYVERVEILIGPASALYGADAFSGVVNIISREASTQQGAAGSFSYGMHNTTENSAWVGIGDEEVNLSMALSYFNTDGPNMPNFYPETYSWYFDRFIDSGYVFNSLNDSSLRQIEEEPYTAPREAYTAHIKLQVKDFELGGFRSFEQFSSATGGNTAVSPSVSNSIYGIALNHAFLRHRFTAPNKQWDLRSEVNWNHYEITPNSRFYNLFSGYQDAYKFGFNSNIRLRETANFYISTHHQLTAGASFRYTRALPKTSDLPQPWERGMPADEQSLYYTGTNVTDSAGNDLRIPQEFFYFNENNIGAFLQYQGRLLDEKLLLTVGGRADQNSRYGFTFNPRLGLVWRPKEAWRLKAFFGSAFLAPSPEEAFEHFGAFFLSDNNRLRSGFFHLPNPDLEPQRLQSTEISGSYNTEYWLFAANLSVNRASNLIANAYTTDETFQGQPVGLVERAVNQSGLLTYGGTIRAQYRRRFGIDGNWGFNAQLAYSFWDGQLDNPGGTGQLAELPYTANHTGKLSATLFWKSLSFNIRGIYRSASYSVTGLPDGSTVQLSNQLFLLLNSTLQYSLLENEKWSLTAFVKSYNLTDNRYFNIGIGQGPFQITPQEPITLLGGLHFSYRMNE